MNPQGGGARQAKFRAAAAEVTGAANISSGSAVQMDPAPEALSLGGTVSMSQPLEALSRHSWPSAPVHLYDAAVLEITVLSSKFRCGRNLLTADVLELLLGRC